MDNGPQLAGGRHPESPDPAADREVRKDRQVPLPGPHLGDKSPLGLVPPGAEHRLSIPSFPGGCGNSLMGWTGHGKAGEHWHGPVLGSGQWVWLDRAVSPQLRPKSGGWGQGLGGKAVPGYLGCSKALKINDLGAGPLLTAGRTVGTPMAPCPLLHFHQRQEGLGH